MGRAEDNGGQPENDRDLIFVFDRAHVVGDAESPEGDLLEEARGQRPDHRDDHTGRSIGDPADNTSYIVKGEHGEDHQKSGKDAVFGKAALIIRPEPPGKQKRRKDRSKRREEAIGNSARRESRNFTAN